MGYKFNIFTGTLDLVGEGGSGGTPAIITATNSGNDQDYTLAEAPTSTTYYVLINNLSYTSDDVSFSFTVSSTTLSFDSPLPSDLANTQIKLVCL